MIHLLGMHLDAISGIKLIMFVAKVSIFSLINPHQCL